jgi:hypothetical protein
VANILAYYNIAGVNSFIVQAPGACQSGTLNGIQL